MEKKSFVREWMELRGLNPHSLSQIAGIGRNTLYRYFETIEGGRYKPKKAVADALGVSIEQLRFPPGHPTHHLDSMPQAPLEPGQMTVADGIPHFFGDLHGQGKFDIIGDGHRFKRLSDTIFIMENREIFEIPDIMMKKYLIIRDLTSINDVSIIENIQTYINFLLSHDKMKNIDNRGESNNQTGGAS